MHDIHEGEIDPLLSVTDVKRITSLSRSTIHRNMMAGRFPLAVQITPGGRRVAWRKSEIVAWAADPLGWGDKVEF